MIFCIGLPDAVVNRTIHQTWCELEVGRSEGMNRLYNYQNSQQNMDLPIHTDILRSLEKIQWLTANTVETEITVLYTADPLIPFHADQIVLSCDTCVLSTLAFYA